MENSMEMRLLSLELRRQEWGDFVGQVTGKIRFENPAGEISLNLGPAQCLKILEICADGIASQAQITAHALMLEATRVKLLTENKNA